MNQRLNQSMILLLCFWLSPCHYGAVADIDDTACPYVTHWEQLSECEQLCCTGIDVRNWSERNIDVVDVKRVSIGRILQKAICRYPIDCAEPRGESQRQLTNAVKVRGSISGSGSMSMAWELAIGLTDALGVTNTVSMNITSGYSIEVSYETSQMTQYTLPQSDCWNQDRGLYKTTREVRGSIKLVNELHWRMHTGVVSTADNDCPCLGMKVVTRCARSYVSGQVAEESSTEITTEDRPCCAPLQAVLPDLPCCGRLCPH